MSFIIAIDGPSCAGKSTIAKELATELKFAYLQSGSLYRAIGLVTLRNGISHIDEQNIKEMLKNLNIRINTTNEGQIVLLDGEDVTKLIRSKEVTDESGKIASIQVVRNYVTDRLRSFAHHTNVIMDGRDIGTTIFPNADVKFYLNARPEVRAKRKQEELKQNGQELSLIEVMKSMYEWDYDAVHRKQGALKRSLDSIYIDTSDLTIEEVKNSMLQIIRQKYEEKRKLER